MRTKVSLITSGVGVVLGFLVGYAYLSGAFEGWESLGTPPEKANRILGADLQAVYVQAEDGTVYGCFYQQNEECWLESKWPQELQETSPDCEDLYWRVRKPPGEVVDKLELGYCGVEINSEVAYVVLKDGSIWSWGYGGIVYASIVILCGGTIVGLLIGAFIGKFIGSRFSKIAREPTHP